MLNKDDKYVEDAALMSRLAKIACALPVLLGGGHKRGKRIGMAIKPDGSPHYAEYALFECPRCREKWNRKVKVEA